MEGEDGMMAMRKAEIETRAPFKSVKEAVSLFGETVLAGGLYANKLKLMQGGGSENGHSSSNPGSMSAELEEAKQSLQKAREDGLLMANCLYSLQEELEITKRELQHLKEQQSEKEVMELKKEDIKFVKDKTTLEANGQRVDTYPNNGTSAGSVEFQKKRYVTFANPPSVTHQVLIPPQQGGEVLTRHPSLKKKKKKPLIPLIGGIFSRKKPSSEVSSPRAP
ncbi:hypothetical protein RJ641_032460 [Dillenia turbinata]|uniref:Uncharacterized protein n=1 Tax=Dillenia turbinata TaxID=194707 RepID=A0AAN8W4E1_9MAGN